MITTPLSQTRLLLEIKINLPILTDEILEELIAVVEVEHQRRKNKTTQPTTAELVSACVNLADLPDEELKDENGCWIWLKDNVDYR
jgi:hypothetical protein